MLVNTFAALCLALLPQPGGVPSGGPTPAAVDAFVTEYREATGLPGAAVAITRGTEVVHVAGYGETASGDPVTADTRMAVASVSKSFTSLAVMQLVAEGRIELDGPVRGHLPEFRMADPRAAEITVRQLLNQTSGMADSAFPEKSLPQPDSLEGAVKRLENARLAAAPGTVFSYHNTNYQVAARLVEVVSGESFADYLDAHVFAPLGMRDSGTIDTERDLPASARGHLRILGGAVAVPEPPGFGNGSGGVISSANDMARWLIAQNDAARGDSARGDSARGDTTQNDATRNDTTQNDATRNDAARDDTARNHPTRSDVTRDGDGVIPAGSVTEMRTPSAQNRRYALGWVLGETERGTPVVRHGGDLFTSTAEQLLMPGSGYGVAVMANTGMAFADSGALMDGLVAMIEGERPEVPSSPHLLIDVAFALATLTTAGLTARGVARSGRWAARRRGRRRWSLLRLLPYLLPLALCVEIAPIFRFLARGRDIMWIQVVYLYPTFMIWLVTAAAAGTVLVVARLTRRGSGGSPAPDGCTPGRE
ncbi:CubicO group peptidase (beta-lactamase class C family) [Streptosporangium becharense]|uniref:CubicO group peptidase (Beta-lactamase class C family) n=1 Tax=Streptosporangium becharense TaxID=1816182 RepID=A0A7W9IGY8_9ACTN|nr:serine hydrolase domain-containing protein [Streptosporangium becharense]MBB2912578.1 CubicO group peptidase (beta-lactamase class C family) [Streptosporangium becharense]MBB5820592.1 CubicO group peptidase (beta-lactamase class C family) [Streptosporangium becharense]